MVNANRGGPVPRPKNEQLKSQILRVAEKQFATSGYKATSYTSIAEACGISRNLVQYHFPKKETLAIAYMESVLARSMKKLGLDDDAVRGNYAAIKNVGASFFETLLAKPGTRLFLSDVISSRELTESVLAFNFNWAIERVDIPAGANLDAVMRMVVARMGGFYELLYWSLKNDKPFDTAREIGLVVDAFAEALGK